MKNLVIAAALLATASPAVAQVTALQRTDWVDGAPSQTTALFLPKGIEVRAFGWNTQSPDLEVGKLVSLQQGYLLIGGYAAFWPNSNQLFIIPWVTFNGSLPGKGTASADLAAYLPLNGGPHIVFSNDASLVWPAGKVSLGLSGSFWHQENGPWPVRYGPTLRFKLGDTSIKVNWQPLSFNGKAVGRLRLQFVHSL